MKPTPKPNKYKNQNEQNKLAELGQLSTPVCAEKARFILSPDAGKGHSIDF